MKKTFNPLEILVNTGKNIGKSIKNSLSFGMNPKWGLTALALVSPFVLANKAKASEGWILVDYKIGPYGGNWALTHSLGAEERVDPKDNHFYPLFDPSGIASKVVSLVEGIELDTDQRPINSTSSAAIDYSIISDGKPIPPMSNGSLEVSTNGFADEDVFITVEGVEYDAKTVGTIPLTNITGSGTVRFVPHEIPVEPPLDAGPDILRIESIHSKVFGPLTLDLIYRAGAGEGVDYFYDKKLAPVTSFQWALVSRVGSEYLTMDARPTASRTPFYIEQGFLGVPEYQGKLTYGFGATNALRFSIPPESKGTFEARLLTFQEYIASATDPAVPEPNAGTFPMYDVKALIADGNGVGTIQLPDLPRRPAIATLHYFVLRTDKVSIADFTDDGFVDANDYAVVLRELGKVGDSLADIASLKDTKVVIGIPDGKVDETDLLAFEQERARSPDSSGRFVVGFERALGKEWSLMGDAPWRITSAQAHGGSQCIQAGAIGDDQTSELLLDRDCQKGTIRFWRKTSCEQAADSYRFFINGVQQEEVSGETDWQRVSFPITRVGKNYFLWSYQKDGSSSYGSDTVWIDDVEILTK